jgi:hypothetical protein
MKIISLITPIKLMIFKIKFKMKLILSIQKKLSSKHNKLKKFPLKHKKAKIKISIILSSLKI